MSEPEQAEQKSPIISDLAIQFAGSDSITFNGQSYTPDAAKGFFTFAMSHAYPSQLVYGTGLVAPVIAKSYQSLTQQHLNYEHTLSAYHEGDGPNHVDDAIIGAVVAASFPRADHGGYKLVYPHGESPAITGVASLFKRAKGMKKILGEHLTGTHTYTVSLEVEYPFSGSGMAIAMKGGKPAITAEFTPAQMFESGYEYIPWVKASDELKATFSRKKNRVVGQYRGRAVSLLMGGLDGTVLYCGLAIVKASAEPSASIGRVIASSDITAPFASFAELLGKILANPTATQ